VLSRFFGRYLPTTPRASGSVVGELRSAESLMARSSSSVAPLAVGDELDAASQKLMMDPSTFETESGAR